ncbi:hypothetical protein M9458_049146, partial [Cirrhinus mrigala]
KRTPWQASYTHSCCCPGSTAEFSLSLTRKFTPALGWPLRTTTSGGITMAARMKRKVGAKNVAIVEPSE